MTHAKRSRLVGSFVMGLGLLAAAGPPAHAQGWGARGGRDGGPLLGFPLHTLNLTSDQQSQVQTIVATSRSTSRPILDQLRQARTALADTLLATPSADVSAQLATINGLRSQLLQIRAQTAAQVLSVLTPDQLTRAAQVKAQLAQLRSQMRMLLAPPSP